MNKVKSTAFNVLLLNSLFLFILQVADLSTASGQGCVAVRPMTGCSGGGVSGNSASPGKGEWQISGNYRYFRSYKHFVGDSEQKQRVALGTQVINVANSLELGVGYGINSRFSIGLTLPISSYDRSSLYEHYGNTNKNQTRFHTQAKGIGDLRLNATYWLFDPTAAGKGNIAIGLGVKLPTGKDNVQDDFHRLTADGRDSTVKKLVDQSIQLGDGAVGFSLELQAFRKIFHNGVLFANGFYLFNPKKDNGVSRGGTDPLTAYFSVADQFAGRIGIDYVLLPTHGLSVNLGVRAEGIPAKDVIGSSDGFRRPGYIISAEPGLSWYFKSNGITLNVPVAVYRNRVKSVSDLADPTGKKHGDAAFADYLVSVGVFHFFGKSSHAPMPMPKKLSGRQYKALTLKSQGQKQEVKLVRKANTKWGIRVMRVPYSCFIRV